MTEKKLRTRSLGTIDVDTPEVREHIRQKIRLAAQGAYPYAVRELMKQQGWKILGSTENEQERENAKLLICYSWWARALESGIPRKNFRAFMRDHLHYLDQDRDDPDGIMEKWKEYGG